MDNSTHICKLRLKENLNYFMKMWPGLEIYELANLALKLSHLENITDIGNEINDNLIKLTEEVNEIKSNLDK